MIKTQIQFPDPIYHELKRLSAERDVSLAEIVRKATERYVAQFPPGRDQPGEWQLPPPLNLGGAFLTDPAATRAETLAIEERSQ